MSRDVPTVRGRAKATARRVAVAAGLRGPSRIASPFMNRYVFPDGELHEVGTVVSVMQDTGFELRHLETLREHSTLTLRHWVENLEANWDSAVREVGEARASGVASVYGGISDRFRASPVGGPPSAGGSS